MVRVAPGQAQGGATIEAVLPRRSAFVRRSAGARGAPQVVAANVDTVFVVDALDRPPNLRRLERYLVLAWESGASPVLVLSKADRCAEVAAAVRAVESIAPGVPVLVYSAVTGEGLDRLAGYLRAGQTVALLGPSGVGKSTLVNHFCGRPAQRVGAVRDYDGKGRHTTTRRQLLLSPSGALLLDTPGLRALPIGEAADGFTRTFTEVEELADECSFSDCRHAREPGCAVLAAVAAGALPPGRLASYHKLQRERAQVEARRDPRAAAQAARRAKAATKAFNAEVRRRATGR